MSTQPRITSGSSIAGRQFGEVLTLHWYTRKAGYVVCRRGNQRRSESEQIDHQVVSTLCEVAAYVRVIRRG